MAYKGKFLKNDSRSGNIIEIGTSAGKALANIGLFASILGTGASVIFCSIASANMFSGLIMSSGAVNPDIISHGVLTAMGLGGAIGSGISFKTCVDKLNEYDKMQQKIR